MIRASVLIRGGPRAWARHFPKIMREELGEEGRRWWRSTLPGHFTPSGAIKYDYQPRSVAYLIKKKRVKGHQDPIVWSGETKSMVTRMVRITSKSTPFGSEATIALMGPKQLFAYRKDYKQPDKADELTTVTSEEQNEMSRRLVDKVKGRLAALRDTEHKRIA